MTWLRRVWGAPLWAHVLVLGVGLLALVPLIGTGYPFSPDEAVAITQARSLANGDSWIVEHPFAEIDPEGRFFPLAGSSQGEEGLAPFAKHPVYPLMLAALEPVGGVAAMVVPSVLATLAAAALAALLARTVNGGLERPVLWAVGVGSPLLFDAYLVIAHSLGAALVTAATLAVVVAIRRPRPLLLMVAAALLVGVAVLFRTEALIFALALGVATVVVDVARRRHELVAGGMLVASAGVGAAVFEKWLLQVFIGSSQVISVPDAGGNFFEARWLGFLKTWLSPSLSSDASGGDLLLVIVLLLAVAAVVVLRWRPGRPHMLVFLAVSATGLALVALLTNPDRVVPGLLVAFPLAVFGIGLVDRDYFHSPERLVLSVTVGLFVAGVLATQYAVGGSAEWGGRYFALGVPALAVLSIDSLVRRAPTLPVVVRHRAAAGLVACSMVLAISAIAGLSGSHRRNQDVLTQLVSSTQLVSPGDGGAPVVLTNWGNIGRFAWPTTPPQRWLQNADEDLGAELASRLIDAEISALTFVGQDQEGIAPYLSRYAVDEERSHEIGPWEITVLVARP